MALALAAAFPWVAAAPAQADAEGGTTPDARELLNKALDNPFLSVGAYYRQLWIPSAFPRLFLDEAPGVANPAAGAELTLHGDEGPDVILGLGYASFSASGPFRSKGEPPESTEMVDSSLGLVHMSASVMWTQPLGSFLSLEYGVGVDLGVLTGSLTRTEAYPDNGGWNHCEGPGQPDIRSPQGRPYCQPPREGASDPVDEDGAHYDAQEKRWTSGGRLPNAMLLPMLPRLGLRFQPDAPWSAKFELAYSLLMLWAGVSVHHELL